MKKVHRPRLPRQLLTESAKRVNGQLVRPASPEYHSWAAMWTRCCNQTHRGYENYGGRGIRVCDRWRQFAAFLEDMGRRPSKGHSLDRIDVNGHYEPSNCRWATRLEQSANQRRDHRITINGVTRLPSEWAAISGLVSANRIICRLYHGWPPEKAVFRPVGWGESERTTLDGVVISKDDIAKYLALPIWTYTRLLLRSGRHARSLVKQRAAIVGWRARRAAEKAEKHA